MGKTDMTESKPIAALRKFALRLPEAEQGTSCVNLAFRVRNKAFVYLGPKGDSYKVTLKLGDSLGAAAALQKKRPDNYQVGAHGWTTVLLPRDKFPPKGLVEGWIEESYRLLAPKSMANSLPAARRK